MVNIPHWPQISLWKTPRKENLDTTFKILEALGNPHKKIPPTIHIAGTNGKGSTLAIIKSILMQAGYSVHSYTSPHILEFNERIKLQDQNISDGHLRTLLDRVKIAADSLKINPAFFEGSTIAAFLAFAETPADILLLETGLGGRLDYTNVLENPLLTIITTISYDHMEYLGTSLEEIAGEKAGIIKKDTPCVIAPQTQEVYDVLLKKCDEVSAPAFCYEYDFISEKTQNGFRFFSKNIEVNLPAPSLLGDHQIINATTAIAALVLLNNQFKISTQHFSQGLISTSWPGRLQKITQENIRHIVGDNIEIYLDGAHNESGAAALSHWIKENLNEPVNMIIGMTNNRNAEKFCSYFEDIISRGVAVNVESEPSSYSANILASKASKTQINFTPSDSLIEAIHYLKEKNTQGKSVIIITGSLFLVADFFKLLHEIPPGQTTV